MKALTIIIVGISLSACGGESDEAIELADQFEQAVEEQPVVDAEIATDAEAGENTEDQVDEEATEADDEAAEEAAEEAVEEAVEAMGNAPDFGAMMENLEQAEE